MNIGRDDIKIKITLLNSATLFARATVILFDCWEMHGWRVMKSTKMHPNFGEKIWIQGPCFKTTNSKGEEVWKDIVYINDKRTWELVHEMINDAFHMARSNKEGFDGISQINPQNTDDESPQTTKNKEVNLDEIPF